MMVRSRDERGSISVWLVTSSFVMMMLVGLAVDLGDVELVLHESGELSPSGGELLAVTAPISWARGMVVRRAR